jgi:hypothetical protein
VFLPDGCSGTGRFLIGRAQRPLRNAQAARVLASELRLRRPNLVVLDPMLGWADRVTRRSGVRSALFSTTFADGPQVRAAIGRRLPSPRRHLRPGRLVLAHALPVPMALAPRSAEQRFIAAQLVRLGVGGYTGTGRHDPARLYTDITRLADDPAVQAESAAWRQRLAVADGAGRAAALLLAEATQGSPTGRAG